VAAVLPDSFHAQLKQLLSAVAGARLEQWRTTAISSQLSLPKLESMDWRVDVQSASESLSRMAVPSVFVELKMCDSNVSRGVGPKRETVTFEMTQDTLSAMLDGLGKVVHTLLSGIRLSILFWLGCCCVCRSLSRGLSLSLS
jgi:COMM domain containing 9